MFHGLKRDLSQFFLAVTAGIGGCFAAAIIVSALISACGPTPIPPQPPPALGGMPGIGGWPSTGGTDAGGASSAAGCTTASGGTVGTGGATVAIQWPECAPKTQKLAPTDIEQLRRTLGRHRAGPITKRIKASYTVLELPDAFWQPLAPTLDQGNLGSCTGNAGVQSIVSRPWKWSGTLDPFELEALAISIYSGATHRDPFDGAYPPDDTGSNGASVMAEMRARGLISGWVSVVTFEGLQRALQSGPCIIGTNWYTSMFTPDRCGQMSISGVVEGGHEVVLKGEQFATKRFLGLNSWGPRWGAKTPDGQGGWFWLKFGDVQRLMNEGAEIECPRVSAGGAEPLNS